MLLQVYDRQARADREAGHVNVTVPKIRMHRSREYRRKLLKARGESGADLCTFPSMPHSALIGKSKQNTRTLIFQQLRPEMHKK